MSQNSRTGFSSLLSHKREPPVHDPDRVIMIEGDRFYKRVTHDATRDPTLQLILG
jgi:hypothetical protein